MPSTSSGRIAKSARTGKKKLTPHNRNHRWESFSSKISKLHSLDPLRSNRRRHDLDTEDLSATTSYLRNGLERWADTNISKSFTSFRREVSPLCDSLAQILHFEQKIMDTLATYLAKQEREALEPYLDLLVAFAHDLGLRFEKHYARALDLIVAIASKPQDVEVIEWTFAALAFLFKYLSRLLVPDLRPTYDVLAPLLGKNKQPTFIARFAAEAMSFLIKKAASSTHRNTALPLIVEHARKDLESMVGTKQFVLYSHGIMTMFAEAIKSTGNTLHSTGPDTFRAIVRALPDEENVTSEQTTWSDVVAGVLTSIVHHSTPDTFPGMLEALIEECSRALEDERTLAQPGRLCPYIRLVGIAAGVRKGQRVTDWAALVKCLSSMLTAMAKMPESETSSPRFWQDVVASVAVTWIQSPIDALLSSLTDLTNIMTREPFMRWFIPFCAYVSELNSDRFRSLFLRSFQKFIVAHWSESDNEELLCVLLPKMIASGAVPSVDDKDKFTLPQSWQDQMVSKFERLEATPFPERGAYDKDPETWRDRCLPKYCSLLGLLEVSSVRSSTNARIAELLLRKLKLALRPSTSAPTEEELFIINHGLRAYLRMAKEAGPPDASLGPLLKAAAPRFSKHTGFLEALLSYETGKQHQKGSKSENDEKKASESPDLEEGPLIKAMIANLSSPAQPLRLVSLQVLELLHTTTDHDSLFATMMQIEQMPFDLPNARNIAVYLRKIGITYPHLPEGSWLQDAAVSFLFGMLTVPLAPVWDDATQALKQVAAVKAGGEAISNLGFEWLEVPSPRWSGPPKAPVDSSRQFLTDFECLYFAKLQKSAKATEDVVNGAADLMLQEFQSSQEPALSHAPNSRSKALKVFSAVPSLAERRSRQLVPHLFLWTDGQQTPVEDEPEDAESDTKAASWSLVDRKALIGIIAQFNNPRTLYQSEKVYDALLKIMANGDIDIQRNALKAILSWKQEGVRFYREALESLLDESKFKNQLVLLLQGEEGNQGILKEHRPVLMPVLLRLLYGRTISKKGAASGRHGLNATRLAVIRNLDTEDVGSFLSIALGPLADIQVVDSNGIRESAFTQELIPPRKQVGLLNMVESIINELGSSIESYMENLINAVLYCLISACRGLKTISELDDDSQGSGYTSLFRVARTTSLRCLCPLFKNAPDFDWSLYQQTIVAEVISRSIDLLPGETTQGVSWAFKLMATWSELPKACPILTLDDRIVPKITDCLAVEKGKSEVKIFALRIIRNLIQVAQNEEVDGHLRDLVKSQLLVPHTEQILDKINALLRGKDEIGRDLMEACVETIVELAPLVQVLENVRDLVDISTFLLNQPSRKVNPKVKGSLLLVLEHFITLHDMQADVELKDKVYDTISSLFGFFRDRDNRQTLARVIAVFASQQLSLQHVAGLCADLNSYVEGRLDEPDYDRRLKAFREISQDRETPFTPVEWAPLLHNMVFFVRNDEEFGVLSSNSADCICKFAATAASAMQDGSATAEPFTTTLSTVVLPTLYSGVRETSETVRREIVRTMGSVAASLRSWEPVADLGSLVPADDDDTDKAFFFNIMSPAVSRQLQAMHLLEAENERTQFSSKNISQFFIPLLEHFIFGQREEGSDDQGLGSQATSSIAALTESLEWPQYRAILRRFLGFIQSKPERQKQVLRLLDKVIDALASAAKQNAQDAMELDGGAVPSEKRRLASTCPGVTKLCEDVTTNILPSLLEYLHEKDEATVSSRVPVAIVVVKLLNVLPIEVRDQKLPGVLTDVCHILRSKAWESREMARTTLAKISAILGPTCFGFVLKELRGALTRGSQLHVLSYTMHSLLIEVIPQFAQGELDYCVEPMVATVMDDIFGVTGQEKDAEEYNSKMKEVKSSKSKDSMELIARNVSITHLPELTRPLQALLLEKLDLKMVNKIDDLLSRITSGLLANPKAQSREVLVFCYEVIQEVYKSEKPKKEGKVDPRVKRYLIQKGASKTDERGSRTRYTHKLTKFALDILRTVFRKHESLRVPANITGFMPIIGDTVLAGADEVKVAAFKLLIVLVKVPFKTGEPTHLYQMACKEAIKSIGTSTSTRSDMAQTSLRLISSILRDRREVAIKDHAIDMLLGKLKDDLTEPVYRDVTFNLLGSVLDRKVETAAVYDTMDYVGTVMITNDDASTRNLARGTFFQFLRDYPQKKNRWDKQLAFIISNLKYEREGGRISVMEVLHLLLKSSADDFVQEVVATCFLPVVMVVANDDSARCCMVAGELVKEIFRRANNETLQNFLKLLRGWIGQEGKPAVMRLALQCFGYFFEAKDGNVKHKGDIDLVIKKIFGVLKEAESEDRDLVTACLQTVRILLDKLPAKILARDTKGLWERIQECLSHPQGSIRLITIQLLGGYLADFASNPESSKKGLVGSHGLKLNQDDMAELVRLSLGILTADQVDQSLADEGARILIFLGGFLDARSKTEAAEDEDESEDDTPSAQGLRLHQLFVKLASIIRKESQPKPSSLIPKLAATSVIESLSKSLPIPHLTPSVRAILLPLRNLTDPSIPAPFSLDELFKSRYEELTTKAQTIMDLLQKRLGNAVYTKALLAVSEEVKGRRAGRATKRKIEAVAAPEKFAGSKRKKFEQKKERRKERGREHRTMRNGV